MGRRGYYRGYREGHCGNHKVKAVQTDFAKPFRIGFALLLTCAIFSCAGCGRKANVAVLDTRRVLQNDWRFKQVQDNLKFLPSAENLPFPVSSFSKHFFMQFQKSLTLQQSSTGKLYQDSLKAYFELLQERQKQFAKKEEFLLRQMLKAKQNEAVKSFAEKTIILKSKYDERITGLKGELQKQYEREKINLELKLKTLRLSDAERVKVQKELETLISKMEDKERIQRENLLSEFEDEKGKLETASLEDLNVYRHTLEQQAEERLKKEEIKLKAKYYQKLAAHQTMINKSGGSQKQLLLSTKRFLNLLPPSPSPESHNAYASMIEKQNDELLKTAHADIQAIIKGMARANQYDLILANALSAGSAKDITVNVKQNFTLKKP